MDKKNSMMGIIAILVLIILGLVIYICYDKGLFSKDNKNNNTNNNVNTNTTNNNTNNSVNTNTTNNNTNNSVNTNTNNEIKELNLEKSLNTSNINYNNASDQEGNYGLKLKVNNNKTATLTIDWKIFGKITTSGSSGEVKNYLVNGFTKNIKSTFIGDLGQHYSGITLFFIMEDNTVEYVKVFKKVENTDGSIYYNLNAKIDSNGNSGEFTSQGTIKGVNNVIKLYNADTSSKNAAGYRTVLGATKDGSFYDLGSAIN